MSQLKFDFSKRPKYVDTSKKLERISFTCSEDFKNFLDLLVGTVNTDRSNLIYRYVLEGMQRDLAEIFLTQPHLNKSLKQILKEGF